MFIRVRTLRYVLAWQTIEMIANQYITDSQSKIILKFLLL